MLVIVINCLRLFAVVSFCCCHGDGSDGRHVCSMYRGHTYYYLPTLFVIVINCLRLVVVIYCYHGDGSDGRHVYKVSRPYVLLSATYIGNSLRLFVVVVNIIAMAIVVMGHICT